MLAKKAEPAAAQASKGENPEKEVESFLVSVSVRGHVCPHAGTPAQARNALRCPVPLETQGFFMMKQRYSKSAGCKTHSTPHFPRPMVVYHLHQVIGIGSHRF